MFKIHVTCLGDYVRERLYNRFDFKCIEGIDFNNLLFVNTFCYTNNNEIATKLKIAFISMCFTLLN